MFLQMFRRRDDLNERVYRSYSILNPQKTMENNELRIPLTRTRGSSSFMKASFNGTSAFLGKLKEMVTSFSIFFLCLSSFPFLHTYFDIHRTWFSNNPLCPRKWRLVEFGALLLNCSHGLLHRAFNIELYGS